MKTMNQTEKHYPEMISLKEAADRTGLTYDALRKMCLMGQIAHVRVGFRGGKILVNFGKLCEYLETAGCN